MSAATIMTMPFAIICASSKRQAMDWSLVLASQAIEAGIERNPDDSQDWWIIVPAEEHARALASIELFCAENRTPHGPWQKSVPGTGLLFDSRSVGWFLIITLIHVLTELAPRDLRFAGRMDNAAVAAGQWWRLITACTLHADAGHLMANVTTGILFLGLAMALYGVGIAALAAFIAGIGGNVAGYLIYGSTHRGLGASGIVMGAVGLLTVYSLTHLRQGANARHMAVRGVLGGVFLLMLFGLDPSSDVVAHLGGFATGCAAGVSLISLPDRFRQVAWVNGLAMGFCALATCVAWWLALRRV